MFYRFAVRPARRWLSPLLLGLMAVPPSLASSVVEQTYISDRQTLVKGNGADPSPSIRPLIRSGFPGEVVLVDLFEGAGERGWTGHDSAPPRQRWRPAR